MICPYCKKSLADNLQFCPECGQILVQKNEDGQEVAVYWEEVDRETVRANKIRIEIENREIAVQKENRKVAIGMVGSLIIVILLIIYVMIIMPAKSYSRAEELFLNAEYEAAASSYHSLGDYKDAYDKEKLSKYKQAILEYENGHYENAKNIFVELGDFEDSQEYVSKCELYVLFNAENGDIITLGTYNEIPMQWIIIEDNETDALLICKNYIDTKVANETEEYACWSGSTLRTWLNNEFISDSFSSEVISLLLTNSILTDEYDVINYEGWNPDRITVSTEDKVYIPCIIDIETYGLNPTSLLGTPDENWITGWLRDRGHGIAFQVSFEPDGSYGSEWPFYSSYGIRPIIRISKEW